MSVTQSIPEEIEYQCGCRYKRNDLGCFVRLCEKDYERNKNRTYVELLNSGLTGEHIIEGKVRKK